jgi:long-chain acyl-CoA synthetase
MTVLCLPALFCPTGAVLTHGNLIASAAGTVTAVLSNATAGDRHICYLPLAHIYERINLVRAGLARR